MVTKSVPLTNEDLAKTGAFKRVDSSFRNFIAPDTEFPPEAGRYHLYISYACPWAHRCAIVRQMKGLQNVIGMTVVHPTWSRTRPQDENDQHCGWRFVSKGEALTSPSGFGSFAFEDTSEDPLHPSEVTFVRDLYDISGDTLGRYSVPILWCKKSNRIVNNESSEIIKMLNSEFDKFAENPKLDLAPTDLQPQMTEIDSWTYEGINNGVYKCGFATIQQAYNEASVNLFKHLDKLEDHLSRSKFAVGNSITLSDVRLFVTLIRFDEVYVVYFKCDKRKISEYPNILRYMRDLW